MVMKGKRINDLLQNHIVLIGCLDKPSKGDLIYQRY